MMQQNVHQTVSQLREWLGREGYSESYISHFNGTTNRLLRFMDTSGISEFTTAVGFKFLQERYRFNPKDKISGTVSSHLRTMQMLSEFQLHGIPQIKSRLRKYIIPAEYQDATERFLAYRRFEGIIEKNMPTISLYLERFFSYITGQGVAKIPEITIHHVHGFLRFITSFNAASRDSMMRTVRQFLGFCFKNGYHPNDLSADVPFVHYESHARIPSAYSYDEVMKLLSLVDRANPVGKRDYEDCRKNR